MSTDDELLAALGRALAPEPREPPADRVAAVRAGADAAAERMPPSHGQRPADSRRGRRTAVLAAAAAAVVALLIVGVSSPGRDVDADLLAGGTVEFDVTMRSPAGDATARATGIRTGIGRTVQLRTEALPVLPGDDLYELWFVGPGDTPRTPNRISAGTFHPDADGRSHVDLTAAVDPARYPTLSITAEPGDGDPSPNGPEVLRADLASG